MRPIDDENVKYKKFKAKSELLTKLGSPYNLVSRNPYKDLNGSAVQHRHYATSQDDFAFESMKCLISLVQEGLIKSAFDLGTNGVTPDEIGKMEELYKQITNKRIELAEKTAPTPEEGQEPHSSSLRHFKSREMESTATILNQYDHKYDRYLKEYSDNPRLTLESCLEILDEEVRERDKLIILGRINTIDVGIAHCMGNYREWIMDRELDQVTDVMDLKDLSEQREYEIERVDEITALSAKKSLQAALNNDTRLSLKYALVHAILRGYNVRSISGACWAQEMSTRCLFEAIGLDQFRKMPGVFLDIEACCETPGVSGELMNLVEEQVQDYSRLNLELEEGKGLFFDSFLQATREDHKRLYKDALQEDLDINFYAQNQPRNFVSTRGMEKIISKENQIV